MNFLPAMANNVAVPADVRAQIVAGLAASLVTAWRRKHGQNDEGPSAVAGEAGPMRDEARNRDSTPQTAPH